MSFFFCCKITSVYWRKFGKYRRIKGRIPCELSIFRQSLLYISIWNVFINFNTFIFYALRCCTTVQTSVRCLVKSCSRFYPFLSPCNTWALDLNKLALKFEVSYLVLSVTQVGFRPSDIISFLLLLAGLDIGGGGMVVCVCL